MKAYTIETVGNILTHVEAVLFWVLNYSREHRIPLDSGLEFHLSRIQSLLKDVEVPPSSRLLRRIIAARKPFDSTYHDDESDDKFTHH